MNAAMLREYMMLSPYTHGCMTTVSKDAPSYTVHFLREDNFWEKKESNARLLRSSQC